MVPPASSPMPALFSDDADFYVGAALVWLLSAGVAVEILWGWIRGHRRRSKPFHVLVLVYGMGLGWHALTLRAPFLANIPEVVATSIFRLMVFVILVIWEKRRPPRPRVRGWGGVGTILKEILVFVLCVLTCAYSVPVLVLDHVATTANHGDVLVA